MLTIWNKTIQSLLLANEESSMLLGLFLVEDARLVYFWKYFITDHRLYKLPRPTFSNAMVLGFLSKNSWRHENRIRWGESDAERADHLKKAYATYNME